MENKDEPRRKHQSENKTADKRGAKSLKVQQEENSPTSGSDATEVKDFPGYPHYPSSEDIYNQEEEIDLNPEDLTKQKTPPEKPGKWNEKDFLEDMTGEDLDVPGSKADEAEANAGREDEENNYYSLGGDRHRDLEEDNG